MQQFGFINSYNFARTRMQARQFVSHAHFLVNGVKVDVPSISLKVGDVVELRGKLKESSLYKGLLGCMVGRVAYENPWVSISLQI